VTTPFTPAVDGKKVYGCGAAVLGKGDTDLVNAFNDELQMLKDSGELAKLIDRFGFEGTLTPDNLTTKSLRAG
jgi:polar amino acid transport system substrate-binding protein